MDKKEYLTEENYEKGKRKIKSIALIILIVGLLIGGSLITVGLVKRNEVNSQYSEESKAKREEQLESEKQKLVGELDTEKQNLITSKTTLENKIKPVEDQIKSLDRHPFTGFDDAYYARKDKIEELKKNIEPDKKSINVIDKALDESFEHCVFQEAKNNSYTSKYCSLKNQISEKTAEIESLDREFSDFNKDSDSFDSIPFFIFGVFVIIASAMISFGIFMISKRREILAFSAQQVMPIAQEGIEKMAPTIGNAASTIGKGIAEGITKGIKEGKKDDKK